MQNKGFVTLFAVLLALVSLYYLSFTAAVKKHRKESQRIRTRRPCSGT